MILEFQAFRYSDSEIKAVTYKYAAPRQLKHTIRGKEADLIYERFGNYLKIDSWGIDEQGIFIVLVLFFMNWLGRYLPMVLRI